jgi:hypothetical protein
MIAVAITAAEKIAPDWPQNAILWAITFVIGLVAARPLF